MASNKKLLVLPGDGIGPEVMREVRRVIDWMDRRRAVTFDLETFSEAGLIPYASLRPRADRTVQVTSLDYDLTRSYPLGDRLVPDGELDLVKGVLNYFQFETEGGLPSGCDIFIHSDAPPGMGARPKRANRR